MSALQRSAYDHAKLLIMLGLVLAADLVLLTGSILVFYSAGIGLVFLINFECWRLLLDVVGTLIPFSMFVFSAPEMWASKQDTIYKIDFVIDMVTSLSNIAHYVHIWTANKFNISILEMWMLVLFNRTFNGARQKIRKFIEYLDILNVINNRCVS